jgi:hypothetical protein
MEQPTQNLRLQDEWATVGFHGHLGKDMLPYTGYKDNMSQDPTFNHNQWHHTMSVCGKYKAGGL